MPKEPDWNNSQEVTRYNYERWKEQQYIDNDNPHGTGTPSGCNPFTRRAGVAFSVALFWMAVVYETIWGSGVDASAIPSSWLFRDQFIYWWGWTFLFVSGFLVFNFCRRLHRWHFLPNPSGFFKSLFGTVVWIVSAAVALAVVVGLLTFVWTR